MAKILISENCSDLCNEWQETLAAYGHNVELVSDGRQAVSACQQTDYEIVITDMSLPDVNGILLSGQICALQSDVSIIGVSDVLTDEMVADQMDGDIPFVDRFLCKPVEPQVLANTVNELAAAAV